MPMFIDPAIAHDIIHRDTGNSSATCPICNGTTPKDGIQSLAGAIITRQMRNGMYMPSMGYKELQKKTDPVAMTESHLIDILKCADDGALPKEIQLIPIGTWNTLKYGMVTVTKEDCIQFAENFKADVRKGVPIDVDHGATSYGDAAVGWIMDVSVREDGLWATKLEWNKLADELVGNKIYKYLSPEFSQVYVDPENAEKQINNVLIATSLVNRPLFKELKALHASEGDLTKGKSSPMLVLEPMKLNEILQKDNAVLTNEEREFLKANESSLTDEQKVKYGFKQAVTPTPGANGAAPDAAVAAKEGIVTLTASEVQKMRDDAAAGQKALKAVELTAIKETVKAWKFNETGGKFGPAEEGKVITFMEGLTSEQRTQFSEIMGTLPDYKIFSENGSDKDNAVTTANELETKVVAKAKELQAADKTLSFRDAVKKAQEADPSLAAYNPKDMSAE